MNLVLHNRCFQAEIVSEIGGNVISLRHLESGTPLLREPPDMDELRKYPEQFGMPVLFPPNRIDHGQFYFEGKHCFLPVTEIKMDNHLHGLAVGKKWLVTASDETSAEMQFTFSPDCPEYEGFPFAFRLTRKVNLNGHGLTDEMTVVNQGRINMPLGLGYHTTFPAAGAQVRLSTGDREYEIGERNLPTGKMLDWKEFDPRKFFDPNGRIVGFHTTAETMSLEDGRTLHGAEIRYGCGLLRYLTDEKFGFWYTWNRKGQGDFISLEPVSWMANALNTPDTPEKTGVRTLAPGAQIRFRNELVFEPGEKH